MSTKKDAFDALKRVLEQIKGPTLLMNEPSPQEITIDGVLNLFEGDPGEPDITLSPLNYYYDHEAVVEIFVQASSPADRDAALDAILEDIANAILLDRTLGGYAEDTRTGVAEPILEPIPGAADIKAMAVPLILSFQTSDPLL